VLYLIPAPLHRAALRIAHGVRRRWWRWRRPRLEGCRVLAIDARGAVLLVRHSYGSGKWMPPGGGIKRGEDVLAAAMRELREETGCTLAGAVLVARHREDLQGAGNVVHVVAGRAQGELRVDGREVIAAHFFDPDALPPDVPGFLRAGLPRWLSAWREGAPIVDLQPDR